MAGRVPREQRRYFCTSLISKIAAVLEGGAGVWGASWQVHPGIDALLTGEIGLHTLILKTVGKVPVL